MYKNHIFQVTTKHLHLDLFVDFQQKVSKVFQAPHTKVKQCAVLVILISSKRGSPLYKLFGAGWGQKGVFHALVFYILNFGRYEDD